MCGSVPCPFGLFLLSFRFRDGRGRSKGKLKGIRWVYIGVCEKVEFFKIDEERLFKRNDVAMCIIYRGKGIDKHACILCREP